MGEMRFSRNSSSKKFQSNLNLFMRNFNYNRRITTAGVIALCLLFYTFSKNHNNYAPPSSSSTSSLSASSSTSTSSNNCMVSFGQYNGHKYKSPGETIGDGKCLVESRWMQIMQHTVQLNPNDKSSNSIIDDWLFIDYHDRINVLVQDPHPHPRSTDNDNDNDNNDDPRFLVFRQTKYALEGRQSLAVVGGIIEPNEDAKHAASREVQEEMGLSCNSFVELGRFRTDVNRGMGWVNGFLAKDCAKMNSNGVVDGNGDGNGDGDGNGENSGINVADEVGKPDAEKQNLISITLQDLKKSAKAGEFLEVQWSNTVALALLHLID